MTSQPENKIDLALKKNDSCQKQQPTTQELDELARFCYSLYKNNKELVEAVLNDKK